MVVKMSGKTWAEIEPDKSSVISFLMKTRESENE
jgi:hypothetical protein